MTENIWASEAFKHATEVYPEECCGLIIDIDGIETYWKCKNISGSYKEKSFVIDPLDYADGEDQGEVLGIVHSHPDGELKFSEADITSCNHLDVDFYLVDPFTESMIMIEPEKQ